MNKERLETLKEILINRATLFPNIQFEICYWKKQNECGTVACVLGLACMYPPFQKEGLRLNTNDEPEFNGKYTYKAGQEFFDITSYQAVELFDPDRYPYEPITQKMVDRVIVKIDQLLEHGRVLPDE